MISSENEGDTRMLGKGDGMDYTELVAQADNLSMPLIKSMKAVPDSEEKFYGLLQKYVLIKLLLPADMQEADNIAQNRFYMHWVKMGSYESRWESIIMQMISAIYVACLKG